jgi:hypothetical protein
MNQRIITLGITTVLMTAFGLMSMEVTARADDFDASKIESITCTSKRYPTLSIEVDQGLDRLYIAYNGHEVTTLYANESLEKFQIYIEDDYQGPTTQFRYYLEKDTQGRYNINYYKFCDTYYEEERCVQDTLIYQSTIESNIECSIQQSQ